MSWKAGEEIMYRGCRSCPMFKNEQLASFKVRYCEGRPVVQACFEG
jgi:hypothetical protein